MSEWENTCPDCLREAEEKPMSQVKERRQATLECGCSRHESTGVQFCNLHLATPELLEACKKIIARSQELSQDRSIPFAPELVIIAEAIAKADIKWFKQYADGRG